MKNAVIITGKEAQYDESAKRLLGQKYILAYILINSVEEFRGMNVDEVVPLIEGTPYISTVPLEAGLTNQSADYHSDNKTSRIIGFNSENSDKYEELIRFDIVFYVRMTDGISQIIINVEAQKDEPTKYHILNRAIFYVSRLISSQKERDFENINYNDIKRVYSIWVCMNMKENSMCHIHLTKDDLLGEYDWKGNLELRKDVNVMCNLSQGIKEAGIAECETKIIINMHNNGFSLEQIIKATNKTAEEINTIIEQNS